MQISREKLKAEADALRKRAAPIWEALEGPKRDQHKRAFESSLKHFEEQRLCIAVMGEFNTGKSTLLNTFIGEELLGTDQLEHKAFFMTSAFTPLAARLCALDTTAGGFFCSLFFENGRCYAVSHKPVPFYVWV